MSCRDDLPTLRAAAEAVAPLPWTTRDDGDDWPEVLDAGGDIVAHVTAVAGPDYGASSMTAPAQVARYLVAAANAAPGLVAEVERLSQREPTREEMERCLGGRDEVPPGDPHPPGWPTVRRCRHCRRPVAGGPTACVRCVERGDGDERVAETRADAVWALALDQEQIEALQAERDAARAEVERLRGLLWEATALGISVAHELHECGNPEGGCARIDQIEEEFASIRREGGLTDGE